MIKKIYRRFILLGRKQQIFAVVWGLHAALVIGLIFNHLWTRSAQKIQPIIVRTYATSLEKKVSAPSKKTSSPAPKQKPPIKKTAAKPAAPAATKPKNTQLLKQVAAALTELETLEKKQLSSSVAIPEKISLESKNEASSFEQTYSQSLIAYLENSLDLPEYGKVKLELCIDRTGRLIKSQVLASENEKNSEFLKNRLLELTFPCFNDFQIRENTLTFTISFRNAETF